MKKNYRYSIAILALLVIFTLSSFIFSTQQNNNQASEDGFIIVRTSEVYGMMPSSMINIYGDGTIEKTNLNKLNPKLMEENLIIIHTKLNEIKDNGYELVSSTGGNSDNFICTTYIFKKVIN